MKKAMTLAAATLLAVSLAACGGGGASSAAPAPESEPATTATSVAESTAASSAATAPASEPAAETPAPAAETPTPAAPAASDSATGAAQLPNPWVDYATQAEAEAGAGFAITLPVYVDDDYAAPVFRAMPGSMLEVVYNDRDANDHDRLCIRKGTGSEDISGDYNTYRYTGTLPVGDITVQVKGEEADDLNVATWQSGGYTYAITSTDDIDDRDLAAMIAAVQ